MILDLSELIYRMDYYPIGFVLRSFVARYKRRHIYSRRAHELINKPHKLSLSVWYMCQCMYGLDCLREKPKQEAHICCSVTFPGW